MKINLIFYLVGLMLLFFTNSQQVYGQYIHKVCPSIPVGNYGVKGQLSSAYFWKVEGGQMIHSNGKDSIQVKWDFTQPKFSLAVVEVSASGCVGDTIFAQVQKGNDPAIFIVGHDSILCWKQNAANCLWWNGLFMVNRPKSNDYFIPNSDRFSFLCNWF